MMILKSILRTSILVFLTLPLFCQLDMKQEIGDVLKEPIFKHAGYSINVVDVKTGRDIVAFNPHQALIPASSLKLLTTFTALHKLGADYQYSTKIACDGSILGDGTLQGNLYIIGSGDPTLGSSEIENNTDYTEVIRSISEAVKRKGITCINGDIIADPHVFRDAPVRPSWQWNDVGNYYASGAWGININENAYDLYFDSSGPVGQPTKLHSYQPHIPHLYIDNHVTIGKPNSGDNAYIFGGPNHYFKTIRGTVPKRKKPFKIKGSVPNPPLFMAFLVQKSLEDNGISSIAYRVGYAENKEADFKEILTLRSPSMSEILKTANYESNNLYCESLLKTLGKEVLEDGTSDSGLLTVQQYLEHLEVDHEALNMKDGSGLSARNRVSSKVLVSFLTAIADDQNLDTILPYLPKAGSDGTLEKMFKKSAAKNKIWAKSGSMGQVLSYTGYVHAKSGNWYAFSVIVNGFTGGNSKMRSQLQKIMEKIYLNG